MADAQRRTVIASTLAAGVWTLRLTCGHDTQRHAERRREALRSDREDDPAAYCPPPAWVCCLDCGTEREGAPGLW